jgi:Domain of unknown function (DUF4157)
MMPVIQAKLKIGEPNNKFEQKADRVTGEVMRLPDHTVSGIAGADFRAHNSASAGNAPPSTLTPSDSALLQRTCACGNHSMAGAKCEECGKQKRLGLQTKLTVNEPGDRYEREPDRIADQVMATPAHHAVSDAPPRIQRFVGQPTGQTETAPASVDEALASPGRSLERALRQDMEQRFGYDFSRVRMHADTKAAESARAVNALAYTVGSSVVFDVGQYAPHTNAGQKLLAKESCNQMVHRYCVLKLFVQPQR